MTQVTIAEVLHYAADHTLPTTSNWHCAGGYSCDAMREALHHFYPCHLDQNKWDARHDQIIEGLKALGCNTRTIFEFNEFSNLDERQGARYLWLKFAALMAEEQGV